MDARIDQAIDSLVLAGTGISGITYADKHAVFTISDLNIDIINFADSGVLDLFLEMFKDVKTAEIDGQVINLEGMSKAELKTAVGQYLIYPLIEGGDTRNLIELVGKNASADLTIQLGSASYKATYSVEFAASEETVLADVDARIDQAIDSLVLAGTGISGITYADKHAVFTISDLNIDIINFADSGVLDLFLTMFKDVKTAEIDGQVIKLEGMSKAELKTAVGKYLIYPLIEGGDTRNLIELVGKNASADLTIQLGSASYKATYSVEFVPKEYTVDVSPDNGTVTGAGIYAVGTEIEITVTAPEGMHVASFTANGADHLAELVAGNYTFTITEDVSIEATYAINEYTVTFVDWDGSVLDEQIIEHGNGATVLEDPTREGYTFMDWDVAFDNVTSDLIVTAQWEINQYTITFDCAGGSAVASISQDYGTAVTAPADPTKEGYTFTGWSPAVPATMPAGDLTLIAQWTINSYTVTVISINGDVEGAGAYDFGSEVTLTATAATDYELFNWVDEEGNEVSTDNPYTFTMVNRNLTLTANFVKTEAAVLADVDTRINNTLADLILDNTGITEVAYENRTATFLINDPDTNISAFAESGILDLFQQMFTDVINADIYIGAEQVGTIVNPAQMSDSELKGAILNQLIIPLVGDNPTMTLKDLVGKSASAELTISAGLVNYKATYTVEFVAETFTLTTATENGSVEGAGTYAVGSEVTLTATAATDYEFFNWVDEEGNEVSSDNPYAFTMVNKDLTITANFVKTEEAVLANVDTRINNTLADLNLDNTGITEVVYENRTATFLINNPDTNISAFAESGVLDLFQQMFTDVINADIYIGTDQVGTIVNPAQMSDSELKGAILNQLIMPLVGDNPAMTLKDLVGKSASAELTISAGLVNYKATYTVEFVEGYTLTIITENGSVEGSGNYVVGSQVTLTATADEGYEFYNWVDGAGNEVGTDNPYIFTMANSNLTLTANFILKLEGLVDSSSVDNISVKNNMDYPWVRDSSITGKIAYYPTNQGVDSSRSSITSTVTGTGYLNYDYKVSAEDNYDYLIVYVDEKVVKEYKTYTDWQSDSIELCSETQVVRFEYKKDISSARNDDKVWLANLSYEYNPAARMPEVTLMHDLDTPRIINDGDLIIRDEDTDSSQYTLSFRENVTGSAITITQDGTEVLPAANGDYVLTVDKQCAIQITSSKDNYLTTYLSFNMKVEHTLDGLVDSASASRIVTSNDLEYPWFQDSSITDRVAYYPTNQGVHYSSSVITCVVSGKGLLYYDYKVSAEDRYDYLKVYVDDVLAKEHKTKVSWTSDFVVMSKETQTVKFEYKKDSGGNSNDDKVWVANLRLLSGNAELTLTSNDEGLGTVSDSSGTYEIGTNVIITATPADAEAVAFVGWYDKTASKWLIGDGTAKVPLTYTLELIEDRDIMAEFKSIALMPEVTLKHDSGTRIINDGELIIREETDSSQYILSLGENVTGSDITVTQNGSEVLPAENGDYVLSVDKKCNIKITSSKENYITTSLSFDIKILYGLEGLVDSSSAGSVAAINDLDYPWVRDSSISDKVAYYPTNQGVPRSSSFLTCIVSGTGLLAYDYKVSAEDKWDYMEVYVDDVLVKEYQYFCDWTSDFIIMSEETQTVKFEYKKDGSGNGNEDKVWVANVRLLSGNAELTLTSNNEELGTVSDSSGTYPVGTNVVISATSADSDTVAFVGWFDNAAPNWLTGNGTARVPSDYSFDLIEDRDIMAVFKRIALMPEVTLSHDSDAPRIINAGDVIIRDEETDSNQYTLSLGENVTGSAIRVTQNGTEVLPAANGDYVLTIDKKCTIQIASSSDNYVTTYLSFDIKVLHKLDGLVDSSSAGYITAINDLEYPWVKDSSVAGKVAYYPTNQGVHRSSSFITCTVTGTGLLYYDYKVSAENTYDYLKVYIDGVLVKEYKTKVDWTSDYIVMSKETQTVKFEYKKDGGTNKNDDKVWLANLGLTWGKKNLILAVDGPEYGSITASNDLILGENTVDAGTEVTLSATANTGSVFYGWVDGDGNLLSNSSNYSFTVLKDTTVKAVFAAQGTYVARRNGVFYSEADGGLVTALNEAVAGDTVLLIGNATLSESTVVPEGVTLMIPYRAGATSPTELGTTSTATGRVSWINEAKYLYLTLTIPEGVTLGIDGNVVVGAVCSYPAQNYQGHTSGAYSQIICDGAINVNGQGVLDLYGLLKGNGTVTANSGAKIYQPFMIADYAGGSNTQDLFNLNQTPFKRYAMVNIQTELVIQYGATMSGHASLYFWGSITTIDSEFVGPNGLIILSEDATLTATYDSTKYVNHTLAGNNINQDIGKTTIVLSGGASSGYMTFPFGIVTSGVYFSIPYNYDIVLENGDYNFVCPYKLMPGASLWVKDTATLEVTSGFYVYDGLIQSDMSGHSYPTTAMLQEYGFSPSANFIVDGTFIVRNGKTFGGIIQTHGGGQIVLEENANVINEVVIDGGNAYYDANNSKFSLPARVYDAGTGALITIEAGNTYVGQATAENWVLADYTATYAVNSTSADYSNEISNPSRPYYHKWMTTTVAINQPMTGAWYNLIHISKVAEAKAAIEGLNLAWDTDVDTTVNSANAAIAGAVLPADVIAVAAEGTSENAGKVVITITCGEETDTIVIEEPAKLTHVVVKNGENDVVIDIDQINAAQAAGSGDPLYDYAVAGGERIAVASGDKFISLDDYGAAYVQYGFDVSLAISNAPALSQEEISHYMVFMGFDELGNALLEPLFA
ncbi:InlB B-repeat-containing protein [Aminicella lysinilytica]|uniref:InlB B-repeat-containing protein n=1 Tax=Aminicella lysinilytica TaxID=433323 RepID=UPI0026EB0977|nr:InlB B-repeat-containing protein [Aminicella lysinilytica]